MSDQSQSQSQSQHPAPDVERGSHDSQLGGNPKGIFAKLRSSCFDIETTWGCNLHSAAYLTAVMVHPLHYYAYVIKPEQNCLEIDDEFYPVIATVLIFNIYVQLIFIIKLRKTGWKAMKYVFTQIPVWLMTLTLISASPSGNKDRIIWITANLFLLIYIVLLIGLSLAITKAIENKSDRFLAKAKWVKAAFNLFLYFLGGQVYGALWYSLAIDRVLACWREGHFSRNHFNPLFLVCRHKHKNIGELNCPKLKNIGTENNEFAIFSLALQSRIVYLRRDFAKKFVYCLRWGLQALSCFGQNLLPSTATFENICVVSVVIYSTVLFAFLIGNMQTYLTSKGKSEKGKEQEQKKKDEKEGKSKKQKEQEQKEHEKEDV